MVLVVSSCQNCLQWGQSNLVDPAGTPKIRLLNRDLGNILSLNAFFPGKIVKRWDLREEFSVLRWRLRVVVSSLSLSSMAKYDNPVSFDGHVKSNAKQDALHWSF